MTGTLVCLLQLNIVSLCSMNDTKDQSHRIRITVCQIIIIRRRAVVGEKLSHSSPVDISQCHSPTIRIRCEPPLSRQPAIRYYEEKGPQNDPALIAKRPLAVPSSPLKPLSLQGLQVPAKCKPLHPKTPRRQRSVPGSVAQGHAGPTPSRSSGNSQRSAKQTDQKQPLLFCIKVA